LTYSTPVDIITLTSSSRGVAMDEDGISWRTDIKDKYLNVDGMVHAAVSDDSVSCVEALGSLVYENCSSYYDTAESVLYYYWYPDDDSVQYLHESYPDIVSPIEGVKNEHFINWMRTAGLPRFRKLYGKLDTDFSAGDSLSFDIQTNFEVNSFGGSKTLVVTNLAAFGGKNYALGKSYLIVGITSLVVGFLFALKRIISPRPLGDMKHLQWTSEY
jgi:hypothetical protein